MANTIYVDDTYYLHITIYQSDGVTPLSGETYSDFSVLYVKDNADQSLSLSGSNFGEIGSTGTYYVVLTPSSAGSYYIRIKGDNDAYSAWREDSFVVKADPIGTSLTDIEGKIDTMDGIVDTIAADLVTVDGIVDTIAADVVTVDGIVDTINSNVAALPSAADTADAVWDEAFADHTTAGSFGKKAGSRVIEAKFILPQSLSIEGIGSSYDLPITLIIRDLIGDITSIDSGDVTPGTYSVQRTRAGADTEMASGALSWVGYALAGADYTMVPADWVAGDLLVLVAAGIMIDNVAVTVEAGLFTIIDGASADVSALATAADLAIVDGIVDTIASDLVTVDGIVDTIATDLVTVDGIVDTIAADVVTVDGIVDTINSNVSALPSAADNADAVWDEAISGHVTAGSFGSVAGSNIHWRLAAPIFLPEEVLPLSDISISMEIWDANGSTISSGEITAGTYAIYRIRGSNFSLIDSGSSTAGDNSVTITVSFLDTDFDAGDMAIIMFLGISVTHAGKTMVLPGQVAAQVPIIAGTSADVSALATAADLAIVDGIVDTIASDLVTVDGIVDTIASDLVTVDGIVDTIAADVVTVDGIVDTIAADVVIIDGIVDTIDTNIDAIPGLITTAEGNIRGSDSDTLETLSDQIDLIATGSPPSAEAIADAVWDESTAGHVTVGSFGESLKRTEAILRNKLTIELGDGDHYYQVVYDTDGTTELFRWRLYDKDELDIILTGRGPTARGVPE